MPTKQMGRERTLEKNQDMKLVDSIAQRILKEDKEDIQNNIKLIKDISDTEPHNNALMRVLFHFWAKYIPQQKQSMKCGGCRQSVFRFWDMVNNKWNE